VLDELEQQILARVIQIVSGSGGLASFLRRNLLGRPLAGPSLPLDGPLRALLEARGRMICLH
jgi:hypothetical protein